jgi:glucoamylase
MAQFRGEREAFGQPGLEPHWTHGNKEGVGTAYSFDSQCWFTLWHGVLTEAYYPTVDRPQLRDLQYLVTRGDALFHEEKRDLHSRTEPVSEGALEFRVVNSDPDGRYAILKQIITDPFFSCILQHTRLDGQEEFVKELQLYALCNPHLQVGGRDNNAYVVQVAGREVLAAEKGGIWMALAATVPFCKLSCGYVGKSDGWTDLADNGRMDWEFDRALAGNVALTGQLDLQGRREFTLGLAFGLSLPNALTKLFQALATPFAESQKRYTEQWCREQDKLLPLEKLSGDQGTLYRSSIGVLCAHEDKAYPGAIIASLSIPWGEARGDPDRGGYHLVWVRDMVQGATALLAAGETEMPFRALAYLSAIQQPDGGFPQNSWVNGTPYWTGIQLDETAAPILLAWRLHRQHALKEFDPYPMVMQAAAYLLHHGPVTQQDRWEEASGYSPSTLAATLTALICAACMARERGDGEAARYLEEYADFLESHLEAWTVTTEGTLVPGIQRHYLRINPASVQDPQPGEDPNQGVLTIKNRPPGSQAEFPAKEIVGPGFLALVRYGLRKPDNPVILDSLRVVDSVLKVDTPFGPCWHRYNHDGYGQREDGGPYAGWGKGRAWPLLTGERGHYALAAGEDVSLYLRAMEGFGGPTGLLPEQVWDETDRPEIEMCLGKPTGSARPLMWAHAEYVKLLRSAHDGQLFDLVPEVAQRYLKGRVAREPVEIWKFNRRAPTVKRGRTLRIQAPAAFRLHWTRDGWQTRDDTVSTSTSLGIEYVDISVPVRQQAPVRFTFFWTAKGRWEGRDYEVATVARAS